MAGFETRTWIVLAFYVAAILIALLHPFHDEYGLLNRLAIIAVLTSTLGALSIYNRFKYGLFLPTREQQQRIDGQQDNARTKSTE